MLGADIFPAGYAQRWAGRHEYDVRRRALARERARSGAASNAVGRLIAALVEKIGIAVLFLKLRPQDLPAKIRQRLALHLGLL